LPFGSGELRGKKSPPLLARWLQESHRILTPITTRRSRNVGADSFRNNVFLFAHPTMLSISISDEVLTALERLTRTDEVRHDLDLELFELRLLDSLGVVELLVDVSDRLNIELSPAEFDREAWATPRRIIAYLEGRLAPSPGD
jgi:D-alanine--poly(phosphoribitol) ligase subunit 2